MAYFEERNHGHTIFVGDLDKNIDESLLWELMIQVGPVVGVYIPRDKLTREHSGYGFVEFMSAEDVQYAMKVMNEIPLYNKPLRVHMSGRDKKTLDIGANIYVGNLDASVTEQMLVEVFKRFGDLLNYPKLARDEITGIPKGYAFIYYDTFEAADAAILAMDGQYLANQRIQVTYAFKKDKMGERHGDAAERLLASKNPLVQHKKELQAISDNPYANFMYNAGQQQQYYNNLSNQCYNEYYNQVMTNKYEQNVLPTTNNNASQGAEGFHNVNVHAPNAENFNSNTATDGVQPTEEIGVADNGSLASSSNVASNAPAPIYNQFAAFPPPHQQPKYPVPLVAPGQNSNVVLSGQPVMPYQIPPGYPTFPNMIMNPPHQQPPSLMHSNAQFNMPIGYPMPGYPQPPPY